MPFTWLVQCLICSASSGSKTMPKLGPRGGNFQQFSTVCHGVPFPGTRRPKMSLCQGQEKKERAQHPSLRDCAQAEADNERIHHMLHTSTIINMRHVQRFTSHERGNKSDDRMTGGQLIEQIPRLPKLPMPRAWKLAAWRPRVLSQPHFKVVHPSHRKSS